MVALNPPVCEFNKKAPDFNLKDCYGKNFNLDNCKGSKGLLVMFICNHCPFVQAILPDLVKITKKLKAYGINTVAIMANDYIEYPADSPENMKKLAEDMKFDFPYLIDETQEVAKAYGAVCTPDFFGYNTDLRLQYRGRFDERRKDLEPLSENCELLDAMMQISKTQKGPKDQKPSIGCSIKWKE